MKIFLDFDDVVFDTGRFREDLQDVFEARGISRELFSKIYKSIKENKIGIQTYDYEKHLRCLKKEIDFDECGLREDVDAFMSDCERYIFDDAKEFFRYCKKRDASVYIVSYGTYDFQQKKVCGSGIGEKVDGVIVGDIHKGAAIKEILDDERADDAWFLDDRSCYIEHVEKENPQIHTILVTRREGRYRDEKTDKCDFQVKNLEEAKEIICKHSL